MQAVFHIKIDKLPLLQMCIVDPWGELGPPTIIYTGEQESQKDEAAGQMILSLLLSYSSYQFAVSMRT